MINQGFTKYELVMGVAVMSVGVLLIFPPLQGGVEKDRAMRAWEKAESIAWAVVDYHENTGNWPRMDGEGLDLSCLTRPAALTSDPAGTGPGWARSASLAGPNNMMGANGLASLPGSREAVSRPWLQEVPLDSWDRPFTVRILDQGIQPGIGTVVVISAGPDGRLETYPDRWTTLDLASATGRSGLGSTPVQEDLFLGDDIGFLLAQTPTQAVSGGVQ